MIKARSAFQDCTSIPVNAPPSDHSSRGDTRRAVQCIPYPIYITSNCTAPQFRHKTFCRTVARHALCRHTQGRVANQSPHQTHCMHRTNVALALTTHILMFDTHILMFNTHILMFDTHILMFNTHILMFNRHRNHCCTQWGDVWLGGCGRRRRTVCYVRDKHGNGRVRGDDRGIVGVHDPKHCISQRGVCTWAFLRDR
jgi:hypothetical protein